MLLVILLTQQTKFPGSRTRTAPPPPSSDPLLGSGFGSPSEVNTLLAKVTGASATVSGSHLIPACTCRIRHYWWWPSRPQTPPPLSPLPLLQLNPLLFLLASMTTQSLCSPPPSLTNHHLSVLLTSLPDSSPGSPAPAVPNKHFSVQNSSMAPYCLQKEEEEKKKKNLFKPTIMKL